MAPGTIAPRATTTLTTTGIIAARAHGGTTTAHTITDGMTNTCRTTTRTTTGAIGPRIHGGTTMALTITIIDTCRTTTSGITGAITDGITRRTTGTIVRLGAIVRQSLPFLLACLCVLMLVTYVPAISLTLPRLFGFN